jgi:hypothetical protein
MAVLHAAGSPAFADSADTRTPAVGGWFSDSIEPPRLLQGYRSALGLKPSQSGAAVLGHGSATTRLLARYARTAEIDTPLFYAYEHLPSGPGLRSSAETTGVVIRGGERWSASFESSTSTDMLTASRRTALLTQIHAPLLGSTGVSVGIRYSSSQTPAYTGGSADTPFGNGYVSSAGRADSAAQQLGYQLQLNYLYGERNTVALTYSSRRESEQFRLGSDPSSPDGSQLSVTGEHWFSPSWALRYDIPTPESSSLIRRQGLRLGLRYRF